jgi:hypothetical protein
VLASITTANPEVDEKEYKDLQVKVVKKAISDGRIKEKEFIDFLISEPENSKFLREIIEEGILANEGIEELEEKITSLINLGEI